MKTLFGQLTILLVVIFNHNLYSQQWRSISGQRLTNNFCKYSKIGKTDDGNVLGARVNAATTQGKGNNYVFGGKGIGTRGQSVLFNDLWLFDESTKKFIWLGGQLEGIHYTSKNAVFYNDDSKTIYPCPREGSIAWFFGNKVYVFGGLGIDSNNAFKYLNDLWSFDIKTNKWQQIDCPDNLVGKSTSEVGVNGRWPSGRKSMMCWLEGNDLYVLGGQGINSEFRLTMLTDFWKFSIRENYWTELSKDYSKLFQDQKFSKSIFNNYPLVSTGGITFCYENKLHLIGGLKYDSKSTNYRISEGHWCFDIKRNLWTLNDLDTYLESPTSRTDAAFWRNKNDIYVYGGLCQSEDGNKLFKNDFWKYDLSKSVWSKMNSRLSSNVIPYSIKQIADSANTPGSRHNSICLSSENKLYLAGGMVFNGYSYQVSDDLWVCDIDSPKVEKAQIVAQNLNGTTTEIGENNIKENTTKYVDTVSRDPEVTKWNCGNLGIFPNPSSSILNFSNVKIMEDCLYTISNRLGIVVQQGNIPGAEYNHIVSFDVGRLETGNYFLTLTSKNDKITCPFQKK